MKLTNAVRATTVEAKRGALKQYRANPADMGCALLFAHHAARRDGVAMVVIGGNSYGCLVYHVARVTEDLRKYTVVGTGAKVALVEPNGEVFIADAE